jgi:hypothetical protein
MRENIQNDHKYTKGLQIFPMAVKNPIKCTNNFHFKALQNIPTCLGIFGMQIKPSGNPGAKTF